LVKLFVSAILFCTTLDPIRSFCYLVFIFIVLELLQP